DSSSLSIGIGHTRWATHGRPSETNAHPHVAGSICVVHNGIIENYIELRTRLQAEGCVFSSETDTEIAAHLIHSNLARTESLLEAVRLSCSELQGSYALVVMSVDDPQRLVVARFATPVILGVADGEAFVASDIPAILEHTRDFYVLEDGEIAEVSLDKIYIEADGQEVKRELTHVTWDPITAEKGGYRHFMMKEIHEQPQVVADGKMALDSIALTEKDVNEIERMYIVACGTAWHASLITKYFVEKLAKIPVEVDVGSEFRYRNPLLSEKTLFLAISQSGETADTLSSLTLAVEKGANTFAICNVVDSTIARRAGQVLYTHAGPEISVASTKAFLTQLTAGFLFALADELKVYFDQLIHLPSHIANALELNKQVERIARKYGKSNGFLYLGRGLLYPVALEGALKLKEISYIHAEGYPAGEMKHGPIALINDELPVVVCLGKDGINYDKAMSNLIEVESRGGRIIAVTDHETPQLKELAWEIINVGEVPPMLMPMVFSVPLQLLAYHVAVYRGTDVDQPRNLAKSVTVE
ncbi:UNVERIFIED_CONTAM: hypothetical protein GTU68_065073, partial [Idotea baltica]|nr:hypothetical protein [Idotea baltica]